MSEVAVVQETLLLLLVFAVVVHEAALEGADQLNIMDSGSRFAI